MKLDSLIKILETECQIYDEYIETETNKTSKLVEGKTEELDNILNAEQMLNMKLNTTEKKRMGIMDGLGMHGKTLVQVISAADVNTKPQLEKLLEELEYRIEAIKQINEYNTKILKAKLEIVSGINNFFQNPTENAKNVKNATYTKNAKIYNQKDEVTTIKKKV